MHPIFDALGFREGLKKESTPCKITWKMIVKFLGAFTHQRFSDISLREQAEEFYWCFENWHKNHM